MRDTGMFTPELANEIDKLAKIDIELGKTRAIEIAESSGATSENVQKAKRMIAQAKTRAALLDSIWRGFMLAHSGLKVMK